MKETECTRSFARLLAGVWSLPVYPALFFMFFLCFVCGLRFCCVVATAPQTCTTINHKTAPFFFLNLALSGLLSLTLILFLLGVCSEPAVHFTDTPQREEEMSALIESTECSVPRVFVFNVPPRSSSTGHRAADWPKDHLWAGRLRLVTSSDRSSILLEHTDTGKEGLFARCPIEGKSTVEQVTDSSRYFVLKVSDGHGKSAYLGVAFGKKEEALEFKIALQTATEYVSYRIDRILHGIMSMRSFLSVMLCVGW